MNQDRDTLEERIRDATSARDYERAATLAIDCYGPELLGLAVNQLRDTEAASEVFADFSAMFWESLPRFEWRCSMRTWCYKLLRRAVWGHRNRERKHGRAQALTELSQLSNAIERVRTGTVEYKRTDVKDRFQELRAQLPTEDQEILVLRVDRGLSWLDLAEVMSQSEQARTEAELKTEAARLRKRFQLAKEQLRQLVLDAGLLDS